MASLNLPDISENTLKSAEERRQIVEYLYLLTQQLKYMKVDNSDLDRDLSKMIHDTVAGLMTMSSAIHETQLSIIKNMLTLASLVDTSDGVTMIYFSDDPPAEPVIRDLWYDTDAVPVVIYKYNGSSWEDVTSVALSAALEAAASAQSTADGKIKVFAQPGIPTSEDIGDLWIDTDNNNKVYRAAAVGANTIEAGKWVLYQVAAGYVNTTGVTIDGNNLNLSASGKINLISGSQINIASGGLFSLISGMLNITSGTTDATAIGISNQDASGVFLWAGGLNPATAPFRVLKDGSVVASKIQHEDPRTMWDMADATHAADFPIYIPSGYTIDSVTFTFLTGKARTFAKAASSGGGSTSGAAGVLQTGNTSLTTGTPSVGTTGNRSTATGGPSATYTGNSMGDGLHNHSMSHTHTVNSHSHTISHTHDISNHNHTVPNHTHAIYSHTHGIDYGINEKSTLPTSCVLKIGATTVGTFYTDPASPVEIKAYLSAGWNHVYVQPNNDARIVGYALVKVTPS